jgi:hypothetical protein
MNSGSRISLPAFMFFPFGFRLLVLQYEVIREGKVLKEDKPKRVQFETYALREYLDTDQLRSIHISSLKRSFSKEHRLGQ